ncbi:hypothetical protein B0H17DRAFT_1199722 [Mycena rosella]|uniref:Uncharacterized protein n=1 Tax=Mycena rosella TaxID=1033263 RepID=A0AAD7DLK3_MYCRO|nr:hypothetical protein B0H17DRAFT_1199722 [Mycena rosella]
MADNSEAPMVSFYILRTTLMSSSSTSNLFQSIRSFFKRSRSRTSVAVSPQAPFRSTRADSLSQESSSPASPPPIIFFSVLGVAGSLQDPDVEWMLHDWLIFTTLIASRPGFDPIRFRYRCIRDILPVFPDGTFLFGEAACDRLCFRIPPCMFDEHTHQIETSSAQDFVVGCLIDIVKCAYDVQPGEKLVLLLVGHGTRDSTGQFNLCITTQSNSSGEAWLTKAQLESAVEKCQGQVLVVWPTELAEALTASASGKVRGSAFSLCALAEVGYEQGIVIPVPRSERRPKGKTISDMPKLPASPLPHSFSGTSRLVHRPSSNRSATAFLDSMLRKERRLIYKSEQSFRQHGFTNNTPWYDEIPVALSQSVVDDVTTPTSTAGICPASVARAGFRLLDNPQSLRRDGTDAEYCARFLRDPSSLTEGQISDLISALRTRHIQSVVVQLIATNLGWTPNSRVAQFLALPEVTRGEPLSEDMVESGILFDDLALRLMANFGRMRSVGDSASLWWLAIAWDN